MDREGLDVAALYPSIGLGIMMRSEMDPKLAAAIARAYNNWLYDFCQTDPKRLKGVAMLPLQDPNEAAKEAQRAVGKLGFVGVFARPEPLHDLPWHSRYFDTVWSCLEELGVPIGFHSATAAGEVAQIGDRFGDNLLLRHIVSHPLENMVAMVDTIGGGVCDRHPKLKLAFLECYCGWVSFLLHRMDNAMAKGRFPTAGKLKPSEYFQRQCWISTEHEKELPMIIDLIGDDHIVFLDRLSPWRFGFSRRRGRVSRNEKCLERKPEENSLGQLRGAVCIVIDSYGVNLTSSADRLSLNSSPNVRRFYGTCSKLVGSQSPSESVSRRLRERRRRTVITRNGRPAAVLMSADDMRVGAKAGNPSPWLRMKHGTVQNSCDNCFCSYVLKFWQKHYEAFSWPIAPSKRRFRSAEARTTENP